MSNENSYYESINPELYAELPAGLGKVLELGCGAGALGAKYKSVNPKSYWCGIEYVEEQASRAMERLDQVFCVDIESNFPFPCEGQYDALVIGDVLEHLKDPWLALQRLVKCIKPSGFISICIPNVGHWTVVANLLAGNFTYQDSGILDRTHLRFFTGRSMIDLLSQAGIEITNILPRRFIIDEKQYLEFCESMNPFCEAFGVEISHIKDRSSVLQYVFTGYRKINS
jgi:SAM-dependent methyltransferase